MGKKSTYCASLRPIKPNIWSSQMTRPQPAAGTAGQGDQHVAVSPLEQLCWAVNILLRLGLIFISDPSSLSLRCPLWLHPFILILKPASTWTWAPSFHCLPLSNPPSYSPFLSADAFVYCKFKKHIFSPLHFVLDLITEPFCIQPLDWGM